MLSWGGVSLCLSGAALYWLSRNTGHDTAVLQSVRKVNQIKELVSLLDSARKAFPVIVSVAGRVGCDAPISCDQSSLRAVILEELAEQHFLKQNETGSWIQDSALMLSISKEVPWYLEDGTGRVFVVGARGASGMVFTVASEVFEESGRSLVRGTLDYLQGLKMLGVKRVQNVLPTGTALTVVGEVVQDDQGAVRIQRPHKGPFYVSPKNIEQLIAYLGKWSRWYKYMSLGFTVFGVYLIASHTFRHLLEKRRRAALHRRLLEAAAKRSEQRNLEGHEERNGHSDIETSMKRDTLPNICVICLEQDYNIVFVPCGHMCCCSSCSSQLSNCPLCRRRIEQFVKTYRH